MSEDGYRDTNARQGLSNQRGSSEKKNLCRCLRWGSSVCNFCVCSASVKQLFARSGGIAFLLTYRWDPLHSICALTCEHRNCKVTSSRFICSLVSFKKLKGRRGVSYRLLTLPVLKNILLNTCIFSLITHRFYYWKKT